MRFIIILLLNAVGAFFIAYNNDQKIKARLLKAVAYFFYLNIVFGIAYKYTKYVRKELFITPMWIVWVSGVICAAIFFSKNKLFSIKTAGAKWVIIDHASFTLFELLMVSTQKRDYEYLPVPVACIFNILFFATIILCYKYDVFKRKRNVNISDIAILFCVVTIYEYLNSVVYSSDNNIIALFIEFGFALLLFFITLNINIAVIIYSFINVIWILVHYFVNEFRGPFIPTDIYATGTALEVAPQYSLYTNKNIWILLLVSLMVILLCIYGTKIRLNAGFWTKNGVRIVGSILVITIGTAWFNSDFIHRYNLYWEEFGVGTIANTYKRMGPTLGFIEVLKQTQVQKPEGYSKKVVNDLAEQYKTESKVSGVQPNIIVVMNETFADIGDLGGISEDVSKKMPVIHSLVDDGKRVTVGRTLVSTFGGNTSKSEYEFLTGSSLSYTPNTNPYLTEINFKIDSLVTTLKDQGYYAVATHPCSPTNWNRNKVYKYMGFDDQLFIDRYDNPDSIRGWVKDDEVYDKVDELMRTKEDGKPLFVFTVTVQNHGGYAPDTLTDVEKAQLGNNELDIYLSLASISDEALGTLIKRIDSYSEPTVLLFFGDHYPRLGDDSFDSITEANIFDSEEQLSQTKNMTPYIIYSNYDIDMSVFDSLTSLNYLGTDLLYATGLKTCPYNNIIFDMQTTIPAINAFGYVNSDGKYCEFEDITAGEKEILDKYYILEYDSLYGSRSDKAFTIIE